MHLSDFDLQQLDKARLSELTVSQKEALLEKALEDLKEARERLQADSRTSSRPPSSDAPWSGVNKEPEAEGEPKNAEEGKDSKPEASEAEHGDSPAPEQTPEDEKAKSSSKPGRRPGSAGHSRTQQLAVTSTIEHRSGPCALCGEALEGREFTARRGLYVLDIESPSGQELGGIKLRHDKHLYGESVCGCGHVTRTEPGRCEAEPMWTVELSEWRLIGPRLASLIVCLVQRLRLSRRKVQEFLRDWLGAELSTAVISQCLIEAGRAVEPLEEPLVEELQQATLAYVDETPWKESGQTLWLWVMSSATVCLYFISYRRKEILLNVLGETFAGWLMSDGYHAYRHFSQRLRCWAHLLRKARGLKASLSGEARGFGQATLALMEEAMETIYQAREGPPVDLSVAFQGRLAAFRALCEQHHDAVHEKTRALAREFLNDWEAIWQVLTHPPLPLTNNEAERRLRHWVLVRRLSQGTRTEQGSRALALLASVIETCRKRNILPWPYLAQVIAERRKGNPAPPLPAATMA